MPVQARLRQTVLAARDLEQVAGRLHAELGLGEPFADPGVACFGLRNAVFALGDTFLEVVSPVRSDTAASRQLQRHGGDCGYMVMFQTDDLPAARERARAQGVREVFEVSVDDMAEVHLHPGDMRGAIVSLSAPQPPDSWRWGGPGWQQRNAPLQISGATIAVPDPDAVGARWQTVLGEVPGLIFTPGSNAGLVEITIAGDSGSREPVEIGGVRFTFTTNANGPPARLAYYPPTTPSQTGR
jgi:hypothetical protein